MIRTRSRSSRRSETEEALRSTRHGLRKSIIQNESLQHPESPNKKALNEGFGSLSINESKRDFSEKRLKRSTKDDSSNVPQHSTSPVTPLIFSKSSNTVRKKSKPMTRSKCKSENTFKNDSSNIDFSNHSNINEDNRTPIKKLKDITNECPTPTKKIKKNKNTGIEKTNITKKDFKNLLKSLHTSEIPSQLVCRENEIKKIKSFVKSAISPSGTSSAMYISGVPGTGKTASTLQVLNELNGLKKKKFIYCYINGMELPQPNKVFVEVYNTVFGAKKISPTNARRMLNEKFQTSGNKMPVIILVDELDLLCTKKLDIIYDIFNWTTNPSAKVSVIAIANTLDLPERLLNQRITSRLGANRICFQPYNHEQIAKIISKRVGNFSGICKDAINLASRKVAALNGDLRKALDIISRAIEIAIEKEEEKVSLKLVKEAIKESFSTVDVEYIKNLSPHEKYIIDACICQQLSSGLEEMSVYETYQQYKRVCLEKECTPVLLETFGKLINIMGSCNLLSLDKFNGSILFRTFKLAMTVSEAKFCLETAEEKKIL